MSKRLDLSGTKRGKLTFLKFSHIKNKETYWKCFCDCGNHCIIRGPGKTKSCGCLALGYKSKTITQKEIRKHFSYNKKTGILRWKKLTKFSKSKIGDEVGSFTTHRYLETWFKKKKYKVHRLIWFGMKGYWPENDIDHINRIPSDNRWNNLREISHQCNMRNCKISKNNTSGIVGVSYVKQKNKWQSQITINKKAYGMGQFEDFDEAVCHRLAIEQCIDWNGCDSNSSAFKYVKENIQKKEK